jgi:hypothetical protein
VKRRDKVSQPASADAEALRIQRLREDARRPLSVNLSEGIALSHKLLRFTGAASRIERTSPEISGALRRAGE